MSCAARVPLSCSGATSITGGSVVPVLMILESLLTMGVGSSEPSGVVLDAEEQGAGNAEAQSCSSVSVAEA